MFEVSTTDTPVVLSSSHAPKSPNYCCQSCCWHNYWYAYHPFIHSLLLNPVQGHEWS